MSARNGLRSIGAGGTTGGIAQVIERPRVQQYGLLTPSRSMPVAARTCTAASPAIRACEQMPRLNAELAELAENFPGNRRLRVEEVRQRASRSWATRKISISVRMPTR